MGRETAIENAIMKQPEKLGFPGALAIRNCRIAKQAGRADIVLLPESGPVKIVLVEAKVSTASDAASKGVGQVLMYYAGLLMIGSVGLRHLRDFARNEPIKAKSTSWVSPKSLTGGLSPPDRAWDVLYSGDRLMPHEIKLFVALDGDAHRALEPTVDALRKFHGLNIGIAVARGKSILVV